MHPEIVPGMHVHKWCIRLVYAPKRVVTDVENRSEAPFPPTQPTPAMSMELSLENLPFADANAAQLLNFNGRYRFLSVR